MTILVIEDNLIKFDLIQSVLRELPFTTDLTHSTSYRSGVQCLVQRPFDRVILDMSLPVFDAQHTLAGTDMLTFGGELILREILRRKIDASVIVLSQFDVFVRDRKEVRFDQLRIELLEKYGPVILGCLRLDHSSVLWRTELSKLLKSQDENSDC